MNGIMQKLVIVCILLPIFRCFRAEECPKTRKKVVLEFYYNNAPTNKPRIHFSTTVNILPQSHVDETYFLTGNQTNRNTLRVLNVKCVPVKYNSKSCTFKSKSPQMIIARISDERCVMKVEGQDEQLRQILSELSKNIFPGEFDFTCTIKSTDDIGKPYDENPYARTSLISIIFLSACAVLTFVLCFGWFSCSYYRRFKQRRIKIQQKKALENSVQKFLAESPVIIFNSKIKNQHFTDDDPVCAICLESYHSNDKLRKLKCLHYFHILCIDPWLLARPNCPLCNQNILNETIPTISGRMTITNDESTDTPVVP